MKILYIGGQKSGKSALAIKKALSLSTQKPIYIATYLNNHNDSGMQERIDNHKIQREDNFITIEEGLDLKRVLNQNSGVFLIDCLSIWLFNKLEAKTPNDKMIKFYSKGVTELRAMLVEYQEGLEYWKERANEYNKLRNIKK